MKPTVFFVGTFFMSLCTAANIVVFPVSSNNTQVNQTFGNGTDNQINIVGGVDALRNEFPWLVFIRIGPKICGGSLIDLDLVLTAAHCVYDEPYSTITVTAGEHDIRVSESTEQTIPARAVKWHENYNDTTYANDIALIWLSQNVTLNPAVRPILLPPSDMPLNPSLPAVIAGWGTTAENGQPSAILQKATIALQPWNQCRTVYASAGFEITENQFCAGYPFTDSCQGDSGGPVLCNGLETVCGVVSFGIRCGHPVFPGVYARVSMYISWIYANRDDGTTTTTTSTPAPNTSPLFVSNWIVTLLSLICIYRLTS